MRETEWYAATFKKKVWETRGGDWTAALVMVAMAKKKKRDETRIERFSELPICCSTAGSLVSEEKK